MSETSEVESPHSRFARLPTVLPRPASIIRDCCDLELVPPSETKPILKGPALGERDPSNQDV